MFPIPANVSFYGGNAYYQWTEAGLSDGPDWHATFHRQADTRCKLETGGKALSQHQNLFCFTATAAGIGDQLAEGYFDGEATNVIAPQSITLLGKTIGGDSNLWLTLPDNVTRDATPLVQGNDYYTFNVSQQKYEPYIQADGVRLDSDTIVSNAEFCVGQKIVFQLQFDPALPDGVFRTNQNNWVLPAKYVNAYEWFQPDSILTNPADGVYYLTTCDPAQTNYSRTVYGLDPPFCTYYQQSSWPLTQPETGAWWVSGGPKAITCFPTLIFTNGQKASLQTHGNLDMLKPHITRVDTSSGPYGTQLLTNGWPPYLLWLDGGPMDFRVYISKTFPGKFGLTQLVNMFAETTVISPIWTSTGNDYYLDKAQEYYETNLVQITNAAPNEESEQGFHIYDSPGQTLGTIEADYTGHWKDYVRFTPDGSDSIPVTIGRIDWNWAATAVADPHWHITSDPSGVDGPSINADDGFPTWTKTFPNGD